MKLPIERNISLAEYTTLQVGGVAEYFVTLKDPSQLVQVADFVESNKVPVLVLGGGSNILFGDSKIKRLVIKNELRGVFFQTLDNGEVLVTAAAGEVWDDLVQRVVNKGLAGLENLSGIPGTVGAAPIQNINAYGTSVSELINTVEVYDFSLKENRSLTAEECLFGYRDSIFKHSGWGRFIVTAVTFRLSSSSNANLSYRSASQSIERYLQEHSIDDPAVADVRRAILQVRKNIGMVAGCFQSAGSFFKNTIISAAAFVDVNRVVSELFSEESVRLSPWYWILPDGQVKVSTAFLLECTKYNKSTYGKKRWRGVVGLSPLHSLSIVTETGAAASDVQDFSELIISEVAKIFSVTIQSEVNLVQD